MVAEEGESVRRSISRLPGIETTDELTVTLDLDRLEWPARHY